MTAKKNLYFHQVNKITTFLNSYFRERIYIKQPLHFNNGNKNQVFLLLQGLYRLKQAAYLEFNTFRDEIKELGFFESLYNSTPYFNSQGIYIAIYIDDL